MRLGDLLVRAKLVTAAQVKEALELQTEKRGRLGDHLVAMGAITQETLDAFLYRTPAEPRDIAATKIDGGELLGLLMKLIFGARLETVRQFVDAIKLPTHIVMALVRMAVERKFLQALGIRFGDNPADTKYAFTEEGRRWTIDTLQQSRYTGPAPVTCPRGWGGCVRRGNAVSRIDASAVGTMSTWKYAGNSQDTSS